MNVGRGAGVSSWSFLMMVEYQKVSGDGWQRARCLFLHSTRPETAQYSTTKFLLARCDLFTAVNALERAECVLKLPSIVKVAATRQNAAGSPQTVAKEPWRSEG